MEARGVVCALVPLAPIAVAALLVLAGLGHAPANQAHAHALDQQTAADRAQWRLPKLFDFVHFKSVFGKHYGSIMEELARRRYFLSRALRAFVSGVNYKYRRSSHFNAVNELSDKSPQEVARMRNKLLEQEQEEAEGVRLEPSKGASEAELTEPAHDELPEMLPDLDEDVELELMELVSKRGDEPALAELRAEMKVKRQRRRRKRDLTMARLREMPLDRLINTGQGGQEAPLDARRVVRNPRSNNPNYEALDLASWGLSDQQESVKWWSVSRRNTEPVGQQLARSLEGSALRAAHLKEAAAAAADGLPDEVFVDHRKLGCLLEARQQGSCGACYAFAVTALMEWLLCQKSGKLVPLSEQYMIDCGKGRFTAQQALAGCEGGSAQGSAQFVHNFGLELQRNYPYLGREGRCPYDEDFDLKKTGFIRMELGDAADVHADLWARILKHSPIYVKAKTGDDFIEYGGGVYAGSACANTTNHAMVLAGHGREDGQHYWLLRNSFGLNWGERGYWKLAKRATERCLSTRGVAFGTKTGLKYEVKPRNSQPKVKKA